MSEEAREGKATAQGSGEGPWVLFSIDESWIAVDMDKVSAVYDSAEVVLTPRDSKVAYAQEERKGAVWRCDGDLRIREGEPREKILWFQPATGAFGLFCDAADDVAAGALVSTHELPPVLRDEKGLLQGLLVPDKRRIATLCDLEKLAHYLAHEGEDDNG